MRLRAQTAKIEGGFVLFPREASWLGAYILELVTFPNSKNDDQVDSTVYALAWSTLHSAVPALLQYYQNEVSRLSARSHGKVRVRVPPGPSHWQLITGRTVAIPADGIVEVTEEEALSMTGCKRVE
jgi:hypothetical protein